MPCPHNEISIVQRSQQQSAVAAAAYQSGEKLFCGYDQEVKHYPEKRGIVHNEILLPTVVCRPQYLMERRRSGGEAMELPACKAVGAYHPQRDTARPVRRPCPGFLQSAVCFQRNVRGFCHP